MVETWDSHIFVLENDGIWTRTCVVDNGCSEIKSYGCPLFFPNMTPYEIVVREET